MRRRSSLSPLRSARVTQAQVGSREAENPPTKLAGEPLTKAAGRLYFAMPLIFRYMAK
jgi:hypothetical protein